LPIFEQIEYRELMTFQTLRNFALFALLLVEALPLQSATGCTSTNTSFKAGEEITYVLSYDWFVIWTEVGEVKFTIKDTTYNQKPAYAFNAVGTTYKSWDWIFKVRDVFSTVVDKQTLKPFESGRNIQEGGYRQVEKYRYNFDKEAIYIENKTNDHPVSHDTLPMTPCTYDIMSSLLYARNIDFSKHQVGDTIPIDVVLDKHMYPIYFRYLGIEDIKLKGIGTFNCIKFSVLLIEGEMFHEGEDMTVWATNDKNKIVVYAQSPILIGYIKLNLKKLRGNRHPMSTFKKLEDK